MIYLVLIVKVLAAMWLAAFTVRGLYFTSVGFIRQVKIERQNGTPTATLARRTASVLTILSSMLAVGGGLIWWLVG